MMGCRFHVEGEVERMGLWNSLNGGGDGFDLVDRIFVKHRMLGWTCIGPQVVGLVIWIKWG